MAAWRTSSYSGTHNCVEIGRTDSTIAVRDTKDRRHGLIFLTHQQWAVFLEALKDGRFGRQ